MKSVLKMLAIAVALFAISAPALAEDKPAEKATAPSAGSMAEQKQLAAASNTRIGPGIGIGLSMIGIAIGLGLIGYAALSGVARQPEQASTIRSMMILLAALVEGAGIIGILFSLAMLFL